MKGSFIPQRIDEITPEWLTSCLRETGHLSDARVVRVEPTMISEGAGFMGDIFRLQIDYDHPATTVPTSLIAKFPGSVPTNNRLGRFAGVYEREINFYRSLANTIGVRVPAHVYSAMDESQSSLDPIAVIRFVDRLPTPIMLAALGIGLWRQGRSKDRYLLMIEDLGHLRIGDQVTGCSTDDAVIAMRAIARLHAQFWDSDSMDDYSWILPIDVSANMFQRLFLRSLPTVRQEIGARTGSTLDTHLDTLATHGVALIRQLARQPQTLLHGDFRPDNLFFDDASGEVVFLDWQGPLKGSPAFDLAYFLSGSIDVEGADNPDTMLLRVYHEELGGLGVSYPVEQMEREYQTALLLMLQRISMAFDTESEIDLGQARGKEILDTWLQRILARLASLDRGIWAAYT